MQNVVALILAKDYCGMLETTLPQLISTGITEIIVCNCLTGKESDDLKMVIHTICGTKTHIFDHAFTDYSTARNALFDYADKTYTSPHVYIINDPADTLLIENKDEFVHDLSRMLSGGYTVYHTKQKWNISSEERTLSWFLPKILRSHQSHLRYQCYSHECITYSSTSSGHKKIQSITQVQDLTEQDTRCPGEGEKRNKTSAELLEKQLKDIQPSNHFYPRIHFYLAQDYICIDEYEKGYELFVKRTQLDGYIEETFEAYKMCGELAVKLNKPKETVCHFFEKALELQKRSEVYVAYAKYLLSLPTTEDRSKNIEKVHTLAEECIKLNHPVNKLLFVNETSYTNDRIALYTTLFPPRFEKPDVCEVCYTSEECIRLLPCSHWLCKECISKLNRKICPFCRQKVNAATQ